MPFPITPTAVSGLATGWNTYVSGLPATSGGSAVVGAIVRFVKTTAGTIVGGVRRGDSTDTDTSTLGAAGNAWQEEFYIGCDATQHIGINVNSTTNVSVYVVGGFTAAEAVFFQNNHVYSAAAGSGWITNTLLASEYGADTPLALVIKCSNTNPSKGTRQTGSTDTWSFAAGGSWAGIIVGLKNNAGAYQYDWYRGAATPNIAAVGYIKAGLTWDANSSIVTPASAGSYLDVTAGGLPAGSVAGLYGWLGTSAAESGAMASSAAPAVDLFRPANADHQGMMMGFVDGALKTYAKVSATTNALRRLGVFGGGAGAVPTVSSLSASAYLGPCTITGTGFGSGTNIVTIDGVVQTLSTVTATTILIPSLTDDDGTTQINLGPHNLIVTNSITGASLPFAMTLGPRSGGQVTNLAVLNPNPSLRLPAIPDYAGGMQFEAYGATGSGVFSVFDDGTFSFDPTIMGFFYRIWNGSVWTAPAFQTLIVLPPNVTPPSIVSGPANATVNEGATATFTAVGAGTAPLTWQAFKGGVAIPGASGTGTNASYTTPATVFANDNGTFFSFTFSNSAGSAATGNASLTVVPIPTVLTQPSPVTVGEGSATSFTAVASTSSNWQAFRNGIAIFGATGIGTTASYQTPPTVFAVDNGAVYSFSFTNSAGTVNTNTALLTVTPALPGAPVITVQPINQTVPVGVSAAFFIAATGAGPITYQWYKNGMAIPAATSSAYNTPPAVSGDNGALFYAIATNAGGSTQSAAATLTVSTPITPSIPGGRVVFPTLIVGTALQLGFDFLSSLTPGEKIAATSIVSVSVYSGTDPSPNAILSGLAVALGSKVTQVVSATLPGVIYVVTCQITTSLGRIFAISGYVAVSPPK